MTRTSQTRTTKRAGERPPTEKNKCNTTQVDREWKTVLVKGKEIANKLTLSPAHKIHTSARRRVWRQEITKPQERRSRIQKTLHVCYKSGETDRPAHTYLAQNMQTQTHEALASSRMRARPSRNISYAHQTALLFPSAQPTHVYKQTNKPVTLHHVTFYILLVKSTTATQDVMAPEDPNKPSRSTFQKKARGCLYHFVLASTHKTTRHKKRSSRTKFQTSPNSCTSCHVLGGSHKTCES